MSKQMTAEDKDPTKNILDRYLPDDWEDRLGADGVIGLLVAVKKCHKAYAKHKQPPALTDEVSELVESLSDDIPATTYTKLIVGLDKLKRDHQPAKADIPFEDKRWLVENSTLSDRHGEAIGLVNQVIDYLKAKEG